MKILIHNVGYFLGHDGSFLNYLRHGHRYFVCDPIVRTQNVTRFCTLLSEFEPDVCGMIEVEIDAKKQYPFLADHYCIWAEKYSAKSPLREIPVLADKGNAILSRSLIHVNKHYLKHGNKRLVLQAEIAPGVYFFLVHLSLRKWIRSRQLAELGRVIRKKKQVIVAGDFNIFDGAKELVPLLKATDLRLISEMNKPTFPAHSPKCTLDVFLCSASLKVRNIQVIKTKLSDHCPVLLELENIPYPSIAEATK